MDQFTRMCAGHPLGCARAGTEVTKELDEKRRARLDPEGAGEATIKKRMLTTLYNARPEWLRQLHDRLGRAVWPTYG